MLRELKVQNIISTFLIFRYFNMNSYNNLSSEYIWKIDVPIFGTSLVRKQLIIALGLPLLLVLSVIGISSGGEAFFDSGFKYFIYIILFLALMTYFLTRLIYKGVFKAEFRIDNEGILYKTQKDHEKKSKTIAFLVMFLSIIAKSPGAGAAGYASQANLENYLSWNQIKKVTYHDKDRIVYVMANFADKIAIFCTPENYAQVKAYIERKTSN